MRLSKIKLAGFKSFVDPTTIHLPSSLIGIVGPNGCGKSNVIDAVRWVMGETSAKHLRGDSMADVIFNGSTARKPVGHASIELVFDNSDGSLGGQYAEYNEIAIKRQVSRDGTSTYYLNSSRCRRRDITDIFLGTGLGPRSYAIIEQGMISRLIEAKPEELRVFLEEAAGISKYKERRRETENRIRHTQENLDRLNDLREEIEKQLDKLQRQARTAERFKELKQQERELKAQLLVLRYQALEAESSERKRAIEEQETALQALIAEQRAREAEIERQREAQTAANDAFHEIQGRYYSVGADIAKVEQGIQHARETRQRQREELAQAEKAWAEVAAHIESDRQRLAELDRELAAREPALAELQARADASREAQEKLEQAMHDWQGEWEAFNRRAAEPSQTAEVERTRIDHLERQLAQLAGRLARIEEEREQLSSTALEQEIEQLNAEEQRQGEALAALKQALEDTQAKAREWRERVRARSAELDAARSRHQDERGRLISLQALQEAALAAGAGEACAWLEDQGLDQAPRLAQVLQVAPGWERAVETVLGDYLEAVCTDGLDALLDAVESLGAGALTLIAGGEAGRGGAAAGDGQRLADLVEAPAAIDALLAEVRVAEDLAEGRRLQAELTGSGSVVTRDGVWLGPGWVRVRREAADEAGILEREREIKALEAGLAGSAQVIESLERTLEAERGELQALEAQRDDLQRQVNEAHHAFSDLRARLGGLRSRLEQILGRAQAVAHEAEELSGHRERDSEEHKAARRRLQEALAQMEVLAKEREERLAQRDALREQLDQARARARQDRDQLHAAALQIESMRTARDSTRQSLERMQQQQAQLVTRKESLSLALEGAAEPLQVLEGQLAELLERRSVVEAELGEARRNLEAIEHRLRELDQARADIERRVQDMRAALDQRRLAWQEVRVRSQTLLEQLAETGMEIDSLRETLPEDAAIDVWEAEVARLEQRIQRLGPINLAAIDEFEEQSERKQYLDAQHADLTEALETLENAIRKIDRETRTRFKETFERVNSGLQRMFPRLFGGGHAYLELTGEDLLDTGVAVMARPPGKRNSTIHLLSGGEKALTAVALVFAIFELNPAPFCLLDEVDAPLDDANVGRFCDLVREMSERVQFIFITHNKITMELAHQLTGVTMNEPGVSRLVAVDVDEAAQMATG